MNAHIRGNVKGGSMRQECTAARLQYPNSPDHYYHIVAEAPVLRRHLPIGYKVVLRCLSSLPATPCELSFDELLVSKGD